MKSVPEKVKMELCNRFSADPSSLAFLGGGQDWSDGTLFSYVRGDASSCDAPVAERHEALASTAPGRDPRKPVSMVLKILEFRDTDGEALARAEEKLELFSGFGERGARIIRPEPSKGGSIFETVRDDGRVYMAYTYRKAPGRPVSEKDRCVRTGAFYTAMGGVLGRLHAISQARLERFDSDGCSDACTSVKGWRDEWAFFRSWCKDEEVGLAWEHVRDALALLPADKEGYGFVHNDAHAWNMIFNPDEEAARSGGEPQLTVIDFDCAGYHWFINDSAVALYSILIMGSGGIETRSGPPEGFRDRAFRAFWEGYRRHRDPGEQ